MTIQARLEILETNSRRGSPRRALRLGATIADGGQAVMIHDLSATGVLLQTSAKFDPFDDFEIDLPEVGATNAFVVWNSGDYYGCEFANPIPKAVISAALLRNPISTATAPTISLEQKIEADVTLGAKPLSYGTKLRVMIGTSIVLWTIIFWAAGII